MDEKTCSTLNSPQDVAHDANHVVSEVCAEGKNPISRRFSKKEIDALASLFAGMGKPLEETLSIVLRTEVMAHFRGVEQKRFKDFLVRNSFMVAARPVLSHNASAENDAVENSTAGDAVGNAALPMAFPPIYLSFSETVASPMLDRLLGAESALCTEPPCTTSRTEMTPLEEKLFQRVLDGIYRSLETPLNPILPIRFQTDFFEEVLFSENFVTINFAFSIFHLTGMVNFAFPSAVVEPILASLEKAAATTQGKPLKKRRKRLKTLETPVEPKGEQEIVAALRTSLVDLSVRMLGGNVTPQEMLQWRLGDVIHLNRNEETGFSVLVEGVEKFFAAPGVFRHRKVFRIL